jgi:pimeloyl-ACP methyl ester carboxylesterase
MITLSLFAISALATCSGGPPAVTAAKPETDGVPSLPLGERDPQLLAAWHRTDAEWAGWIDPSANHVHFIVVPGQAGKDLRLEVVDWGGRGPAVVLLAGLGESGHIYNDLAPRLTDQFRVIALTRRGHGASSHADSSTYVLDTLAADITAVMDSLRLKRASLVGHSIAGAEITRVAVRFPGRVDKLVYLDASHDFAGVDSILSANPAWPAGFVPSLGTATDTLNAARNRSKRYRFGYWSDALESGILRSLDSDPAATSVLLRDATFHPKEYRRVQAPALALTARYTMQNWFFYLDPRVDSAKWKAAEHWLTMVLHPWLKAGRERFRREMKDGRTIELEADHHLFNSHPNRVSPNSALGDVRRNAAVLPSGEARETREPSHLLLRRSPQLWGCRTGMILRRISKLGPCRIKRCAGHPQAANVRLRLARLWRMRRATSRIKLVGS